MKNKPFNMFLSKTPLFIFTISIIVNSTPAVIDSVVNYDTAWTFSYDGGKTNAGSYLEDNLRDVKVLSNGGYVCVGVSGDTKNTWQALILKLDINGKLLQKKLYSGDSSLNPRYKWQSAHSIVIAKNGDFLIGGDRQNAPWVMRIDSSTGNEKWGAWYYDSLKDNPMLQGSGIINSIKETAQGKIICVTGDDLSGTGTKTNFASFFALDSLGTFKRVHQWNQVSGYNIGGYDIEEVTNGTYFMSGNETVVAMDTNSTEIWKAKYTYNVDNVGSEQVKVNRAKVLRDGRIFVIGQQYELDSYAKWQQFYYDGWWAEIAFAYGTVTFSDTVGYKKYDDNLVDFTQLADDKLVFVGYRGGQNGYSNIWVVVTDSTGRKKLFNKTFFTMDSATCPTHYPLSVAASPDSGFTVVGYGNCNGRNGFAAHFVQKPGAAVSYIKKNTCEDQFEVRKIGNELAVLKGYNLLGGGAITLFTISGRRITSLMVAPARTTLMKFDLSHLSCGMYFVQLKMNKEVRIAKFTINQ